jgi:adenylate kinase
MEEHIRQVKQWLQHGSINIFGKPFAGKDTQGQILAELLDGELIAGGDILRSYHDQEQINRLMSTGNLFPTDLYLQIVLPYLSRPEIANKPLMLSAVGRLSGEETVIMKATHDSGHPIKAVVLMDLSEQEVWRRFEESLKQHDRGDRADDHREVLQNRLKKYEEKTQPVISFYRQQGLLVEVDGSLPREEVTKVIFERLAERAASA